MTFGKFLAIAFGCHQRPDRSFFFHGKQFPLCARCTGVLTGYFAGIAVAIITKCAHYPHYLFCLLPMLVDGGVQRVWHIESNNIRRLITGLFGGIGIVYCFITVHFLTVMLVKAILRRMYT